MTESIRVGSTTGVELSLQVAGPGARSYAFVIDWHIRLLLALCWLAIAHLIAVGPNLPGTSGEGIPTSYYLLVLTPAFAIYFLYHPVLEIAMNGRTPGKRIAGIRIVDETAGEPGVTALLIRNVFRLLDSLPVGYVLGLVTTMLTRSAVRIGDIAAGTVLVYDAGRFIEPTTSMGLNPADMTHHGLNKGELAYDLLQRWQQLEPPKRQNLASRLIVLLGGEVTKGDDDIQLRTRLEELLRGGQGKPTVEPSVITGDKKPSPVAGRESGSPVE